MWSVSAAARTSTTTRPTSAWPTSDGPAGDARPTAGTYARTSTWAATNANSPGAAVPTVPSCAAAPAEATAPSVAAPIVAGATPAIVVPAVILSAVDELSLFQIAWNRRGREAIDRKSVRFTNRAQQGKRNQRRGGTNPSSHYRVSFFIDAAADS